LKLSPHPGTQQLGSCHEYQDYHHWQFLHRGNVCSNIATTLGLISSFLQAEDVTFDFLPVDISPFQSHRIVSNRFGRIHVTFDLIFQVIESLSAYIGYYPNRSLLTLSCPPQACGWFPTQGIDLVP
jgi:hypothetical protein